MSHLCANQIEESSSDFLGVSSREVFWWFSFLLVDKIFLSIQHRSRTRQFLFQSQWQARQSYILKSDIFWFKENQPSGSWSVDWIISWNRFHWCCLSSSVRRGFRQRHSSHSMSRSPKKILIEKTFYWESFYFLDPSAALNICRTIVTIIMRISIVLMSFLSSSTYCSIFSKDRTRTWLFQWKTLDY